MSKYLKGLIKASGDEYASIVADGIIGNDTTFHLDTGCYALNALITGDLFKGPASNRAILLAGEESTGKTYYAMEMVYHFVENHDNPYVIYFDTEKSLEEDMFEKRGIDASRVGISQPSTIQEFRTTALRILEQHEKEPEEERPALMFVLDSMGMLSSNAEVENMSKGKDVADMKKASLWKATFRAMTLKMGIMNVPFVIVGHTYANIGGYGPARTVAGGGGAKYATSNIIDLRKKKLTEGEGSAKQQVGVEIVATNYKSRHTREGKSVTTTLLFDQGLDRYSGLLDMAEQAGVWKKLAGGRYQVGEDKPFGKHIKADPEKYFTEEVLEQINEWVSENFKLSGTDRSLMEEDLLDDEG